MAPKTEEKNGKILVSFNPEIDSELKEFSESSISEGLGVMKYSALNLWANYKILNDERNKQYEQYNNNPKQVFEEVKEVIEGFEKSNYDYFLFNRSIPGNACSVLVRDYYENLSKEERNFCKEVILYVASSSLRENYDYQLGDGVDAAISVLPILLKEFPEEKDGIKIILLLTLFDLNPMGAGQEFCNYSKRAVLSLWDISFDDAQSLLLGYLWLKPKYEDLRSKLRKKNYEKNVYELYEIQLIKEFDSENETELKKVIDNKITLSDLNEIEKSDSYVLKTAFQLIPSKTNNGGHKKLAEIIISTIAKDLLLNKREDEVDYWVRLDFLEKLADFVLNSSEQDIPIILRPFIDNFNNSETMADLFQKFIYAEDRLDVYNNFWMVWNLFYEKMVELCENGDNWKTKKVIKSYLFAEIFWKKEATEWHTLKEIDKRFFKKITENGGRCPSVLYSIAKLLNGIGSIYLDDGVLWISRMLNVNENLWSEDLDENTIYYLESIVRKYVYRNRENLRRMKQLKQEFLVLLDFLIEKGSENGYLLRENIL